MALQNLPVRFAIDRAGLVGADGPTHAGAFDPAYLGTVPNMMLMAAADEVELMHMVAHKPFMMKAVCCAYPRGEAVGLALPARGTPLEIGKGRVIREGGRICLLSYGTRLEQAVQAAERLDAEGWRTSVVDARFMKPLDGELIARMAGEHEAFLQSKKVQSAALDRMWRIFWPMRAIWTMV